MAKLKYDTKLRNLQLIGAVNEHYNVCFKETWEQAKAILKPYGITLSDYEVIFADNEYKTETKSEHFGATSGAVFYKDIVIARGSIDGSNYCDREGKLIIYLSTLERIYGVPNTALEKTDEPKKKVSKDEGYKLVGILNMFDLIPDFIYPVFEKDGQFYFHFGIMEELKTEEFLPIKTEIHSKIVKFDNLKVNNSFEGEVFNLETAPVFGFQTSENEVFLGHFAEMKKFLETFEAKEVFLRNEIKDFIECVKTS